MKSKVARTRLDWPVQPVQRVLDHSPVRLLILNHYINGPVKDRLNRMTFPIGPVAQTGSLVFFVWAETVSQK